jgi:hypothetical protein
MTLLESALAAAPFVSVVTIIVLARYAQLEHERRLRKATDAFRLG